MNIVKSVGDWGKGANNAPGDVAIIQGILTSLSTLTKDKSIDPKGIDKKIAKPPKESSTVKAILAFQESFMKTPDGVISPGKTTIKNLHEALIRAQFPQKPSFTPIVGNVAKANKFGKFTWKAKSKSASGKVSPGSGIIITDGWDKSNIQTIEVPHLRTIPIGWGGNTSKMSFNKLATAQLVNLWTDWHKAGLLSQIQTYDGSYNPRLQRGSISALSSHAWGTAFDINAKTNGIGKIPPYSGQPGCIRELVQIANSYGFYWGGHFGNRPDGMHFEVVQLAVMPKKP